MSLSKFISLEKLDEILAVAGTRKSKAGRKSDGEVNDDSSGRIEP